MADDAKRFALLYLEGYIVQCKKFLTHVRCCVGADLAVGVFLALQAGHPALKIAAQRTAADCTKAVFLGDMFDFDCNFVHFTSSDCIHKGFFHAAEQHYTKKQEYHGGTPADEIIAPLHRACT